MSETKENSEKIKTPYQNLSTSELREKIEKLDQTISDQEAKAKMYRYEPCIEKETQELSVLAKIIDLRLEKEAIDNAKAEKNPPALIFVESYYGDTYGLWGRQVYILDENNEYVPTDISDELHFGNEDSEVEAQLEWRGELVETPNGLYHRNAKTGRYDPLEKDPNYTYRVLSNNAYWRDIKSSELQLYHQGAERESELVSKNPVTGKFENIPFNITRSHNNYLEGFHQDDEGNPKTIIYKRNMKDGKFYPDAEFPYGECMSCMSSSKSFSITFMSETAAGRQRFRYTSRVNRDSLLECKRPNEEEFVPVDKFTQEPLPNTPDLLAQKLKEIKCKINKDQYMTEESRKPVHLNEQDIGKTGNSTTGKILKKDKEVAAIQTQIAKEFIRKNYRK